MANSLPLLVVIPAACADQTLPHCLRGLSVDQRELDFQVIIVRDDAVPANLKSLPSGCAEVASRGSHSAASARNTGAASLPDGIIIFVDADVVPDPGAIAALCAPIISGEADATTGNYSRDVSGLNFLQSYKQLYISAIYRRHAGFLQNEFWTALCAVRAETFHQIGGFDERSRGAGGEDTEFGQRLTRAGFRIKAVLSATGRHLHRFSFFGLLQNDFHKGRRSMLNGLRNRRLQDHRHSTGRDIISVACAYGLLLIGVLTGMRLRYISFAGLLWLYCRRDLLVVWAAEGSTFLLRSIPLAWLLDLVRGICVIAGTVDYARESNVVRSLEASADSEALSLSQRAGPGR